MAASARLPSATSSIEDWNLGGGDGGGQQFPHRLDLGRRADHRREDRQVADEA